MALPERQPPDADGFAIRRDCRAFGEGVLAVQAYRLDQIRLGLSVDPLDAQQDHRRTPVAGHCKVRVEIVAPADHPEPRKSRVSLYDRLNPLIGAAKDLPPDASVNVDHYLYGHPKK